MSERSIFVFPDTSPKHAHVRRAGRPHVLHVERRPHRAVADAQHDHADAGIAVQPAIIANKTANTITVRATASVMQIIEKIIEQNDKPRAEIVVDVEILEVDRVRTKAYGLNLSEYALGAIFSPEVSPNDVTVTTAGVRVRRRRRHSRRHSDDSRHRVVDAAERREVAAAVQPEHDLARRQHVRFLPRGAHRDRAGFSRATATRKHHRQAADARCGGQQVLVEARRQDSRRFPRATRRSRPAARASTR